MTKSQARRIQKTIDRYAGKLQALWDKVDGDSSTEREINAKMEKVMSELISIGYKFDEFIEA